MSHFGSPSSIKASFSATVALVHSRDPTDFASESELLIALINWAAHHVNAATGQQSFTVS